MADLRAFKSQAEQRRLQKLVEEGTFPRGDYDHMLKMTDMDRLPERANQKKIAKNWNPKPKLSDGGSQRYGRTSTAEKALY